jgi:hypothetical protein
VYFSDGGGNFYALDAAQWWTCRLQRVNQDRADCDPWHRRWLREPMTNGFATRRLYKHSCEPSHCRRYQAVECDAQSIDTRTIHIGFRYVIRSWLC